MRKPSDLVENLKLGRQVTITNFYAPYWSLPDFVNTPVTFVPYVLGQLEIKDLAVVQLDLKTGFQVTREEAQARGCAIVEKSDDDIYFIELRKPPINGILYAFAYDHYSAEDRTTYYILYPFTDATIYGRAIDQDLIFTDAELSDGLERTAERVTPQNTSQLEVQYYLLAASTKPVLRALWVFRLPKNFTLSR